MADDTRALAWPAIIDTVVFTVLKVLLIPIATDVIHCKITCENIPKMARSCLFAPDKSELTDKKIEKFVDGRIEDFYRHTTLAASVVQSSSHTGPNHSSLLTAYTLPSYEELPFP